MNQASKTKRQPACTNCHAAHVKCVRFLPGVSGPLSKCTRCLTRGKEVCEQQQPKQRKQRQPRRQQQQQQVQQPLQQDQNSPPEEKIPKLSLDEQVKLAWNQYWFVLFPPTEDKTK